MKCIDCGKDITAIHRRFPNRKRCKKCAWKNPENKRMREYKQKNNRKNIRRCIECGIVIPYHPGVGPKKQYCTTCAEIKDKRKSKENMREYRKKNARKIRNAKRKKYRETPELRAYHQKYSKKYYIEHKEKLRKRALKWYHKNKKLKTR